jgi:ubiquinone/menaquinone biosynthesis C-methylase UbiE
MAKYDSNWVRSYYDEYGKKEWDRWDKNPVEQIKFEVHLYYLRKYLQANDRILEIGAGAGRFTQELGKISKNIVVADISPVQLQLNQENAHKLGFSESIEFWVECDLCDLRPSFHEEEFDAIVCYGGPLSYVFDERETAIQELLRVTKLGGLLFFGVMSLWGSVHHLLPGVLEIAPDINREIIASGDLDPDNVAGANHFCHMYRATEFRAFLETAGLNIEVLSASDCLSATWSAHLNTIQRNQDNWRHLLEMELEACQEPGCLDMGTHLIAVCKKTV